jgi:hypothetical protein
MPDEDCLSNSRNASCDAFKLLYSIIIYSTTVSNEIFIYLEKVYNRIILMYFGTLEFFRMPSEDRFCRREI